MLSTTQVKWQGELFWNGPLTAGSGASGGGGGGGSGGGDGGAWHRFFGVVSDTELRLWRSEEDAHVSAAPLRTVEVRSE